jgi:hypothetical protein
VTRLPLQRTGAHVIAASCALALAAMPSAASASAIDPGRSTIGSSAELNAGGTTVMLRGVVQCATCKRFTLGATVSQHTTGAVAQGGVRCVCRGSGERWVVTARAREATAFRAGPARVCVWIIGRGTTGEAIDARQWCRNVKLKFAAA